MFQLLGRFHTVDSESEDRIHFYDRFDCQYLHLRHCQTNFSFNIKRPMHKKPHLRIPLKFAFPYFFERQLAYQKIGGDFLISHFHRDSIVGII